MTDIPSRSRAVEPDLIALAESVLLALIVITIGLKLHLIFVLNINWDEFGFLASVHEFARGTLNRQFQTFHVHLFGWLPLVSDSEIDQVIAGRAAMLLLGLGSALLTYLIGRLFFERLGALFAVLCLFSLDSVMQHGSSFRADPLGALFLLAAIYALLRPSSGGRGALLSGAATALALLITIKSAIFLAVIGAIFLCRLCSGDPQKIVWRHILLFALALLAVYAGLYGFHVLSLGGSGPTRAGAFVGDVASKVIVFDAFFPRWRYFIIDLATNFWVWALLVAGASLVVAKLRRSVGRQGRDGWLLLTFLIPVLSLLLYRNAFPYFYVFIMSPAVVLCGAWVDRMAGDFRAKRSKASIGLVGLLTLPVAAGMLDHYLAKSSDATKSQREIVQLVHRIFPEPVAYIDRCAMISSYPKQGFFMSTWGLESYAEQAVPIMRRILREHQPRFLIANSPVLDLSRPREDILAGYGHALLAEDFEALGDNFVPHWGLLYVAGKRFSLEVLGKQQEFEILIPGRYTVEADAAVTIDGATLRPGDPVELTAGRHAILSNTTPTQVVLRWGDHLYRPPGSPSSQAFFARF